MATAKDHLMTATKYVYRFSEGNAGMRDLLGGKGANLCEMVGLGLPVPPGFVISTDTCREYYRLGRELPDGLMKSVRSEMAVVEGAVGRRFGDPAAPLLVSVRSGSKFSMPGMMDTILNLGLTADTVRGFAEATGDRRFALDSYRRFLQLFGKVALYLDTEPFEEILKAAKESAGVASDAELDERALEDVVERFERYARSGPHAFPDDPWEQLELAIRAVFDSWNNARATAYREYQGISHDLGTAVSIMAMVFGNSGWDSGTGVCFTRNPASGTRELYGEFLANAQGEDVVSGVRTPRPISELATEMPAAHTELVRHGQNLENHFRDVQDIEFTIEHGKLYILQTRSAKRTAMAAVKTAVDMTDEGLISKEEAILRVPASDLMQLLVPLFDEEAKQRAVEEGRLLGRGLNASPGAATGQAVFDSETAVERGAEVILVRPETSPDDMPGMLRAAAVLTSRGGITSHAAVVTRGLGKPAVVGCSDLYVDLSRKLMAVNGTTIHEGEDISIDGFTGEVFAGRIETIAPDISRNDALIRLLEWADGIRRLAIRANADTPNDAAQARGFGAHGIGLCRTEHMFFQPERLPSVRRMLMSAGHVARLEQKIEDARVELQQAGGVSAEIEKDIREAQDALEGDAESLAYREALAHLEEYQTADFSGILRTMDGLPVVIRLLDAPLHEFLPPLESLIDEFATARASGAPAEELAEKEHLLEEARSLRESNPMLGHRGSRLGLTYPAIYEMQVRAILAATNGLKAEGLDPRPEIMMPLIMGKAELVALQTRLRTVATAMGHTLGKPGIHFGTMIELPRAALLAGELADHADFFSFGSNDLTQMTFGFSRDDAEEKFLRFYLERGLLPQNPFATLDEAGVGRLIRIAVEEGRAANPRLELGLCGEHGGDPQSIVFCESAGLDYVSCSPLRVPVARLAAAAAALGEREKDV
ncbi:MAG: pyruvate, phosphate dikinase [Dehalococcoidia bacterium]